MTDQLGLGEFVTRKFDLSSREPDQGSREGTKVQTNVDRVHHVIRQGFTG